MNKRRERTLQDLCDATPTLSQPQSTPILRGNFRMQGPVDEANCDLLTNMVTSQITKGFSSCSDRSQKVDYREKCGTCNVCSAPCSSCFHSNKVLMKSNDESAGETRAENIVVGRGKRCEIGQLSEVSTVAGMNSNSDSFSENAAGKASSRTSDASASEDNVVHSKSEGRRVPEGHDDCLSCVSGTDEHAYRKSDTEDSRLKSIGQSKIIGESSDKVPPSSSPTGLYSQIPGWVELPLSKSTDYTTDLLKGQNTFSKSSNGEILSHDPNSRDVKDDKPSDTKDELLAVSTGHLDSLPTRGVASNVACGDPPPTALNSIKKNDDMEVEIHPIDEIDDSDVEQDVKVCDICGDAGREDLLAICCRCSDGAEHTYCMREMLAKVPEGEWLCEECKSVEPVGNERQEKIGRVEENEKNNSSGQASSEYVNSSDVDRCRTKGYMKIPGKRLRDDADAEVSSVVKKPALGTIVGSPKTSNSSKPAALSLSRENSLKNIDKGRLQFSHHSSSDTVPVNDTPESASSASDLQVQNFRGTFSKSNSFNSLNSKPKVKLVDQVVIQRQNSAREHASFRLKEGVARSIGKSMSFKSTNSSRSESKTKMLSPRLAHIQDNKNIKPRSTFERQRSFRTEHPSNNSKMGTFMGSTSRINKRLASREESSSPTTSVCHNEIKPVQTDGKSAAISRSSSLAARRSADLSSSIGEFKRPLIYGHSTLGVSSANGVNNIVQKSSQTSLKEDPSSCSVIERPPFNANECLPDGLPRSRDLTNSGERMREYTGSRFWPPSVNSSRDESDNLKAAIEAAVLRKPGVYRKHRALGQSDDSCMSSMGCEVASYQDHISNSAAKEKMSSDVELLERPTLSRSLTADSLKQETPNNVKQFPLVPVNGLSSVGGDSVPIFPSSRDVFCNVSAAMPFFLKSLAIPEQEYIWQGSFEICRSGKTFDLWDGIQAHLSTFASTKVLEAVNKFKSRIVLNEVPRLSTWPIQFQEYGAREENIALFFFAKDLESYDKYKVMLDNMIKNDLALKGNVNGVELLIFPSNQLPDNSQRWNMLFYLWGVFRGKKESCLQHMPESLNQIRAPRDIPPAIMSLPENRCSLRPITEDLPASNDAAPMLKVHAPQELCSLLSSGVVNGDCGTKDQLDSRLNSSSPVAVQRDTAKQCQEIRGTTCQERGISSSGSPPLQSMRSSTCSGRSSTCSGREQMQMQLDTPLDRQQSSHHFSKIVAGTWDMAPEEGIGERTILDKRTCNQDQDQVKLRMDVEDLSTDGETPFGEERDLNRDLNVEHNRWLLNHKERMHPESYVVPRTLYAGTSQVLLRDNDAHDEPCGALEKVSHRLMSFTELGGWYTCNDGNNSCIDGFMSQMNHVPSGSCVLQNRRHEACAETLILEYNENAERRFFPIESQPVKGIRMVDGSTPWKMDPLEQDRLHERAPNLELALGAERKPLTQGNRPLLASKVDQKINEEHILHEAGTKAEEDDESATLSLSLSFPFPEMEQSTKAAPKTEQLLSEREHGNTSMLLFGNLRDN